MYIAIGAVQRKKKKNTKTDTLKTYKIDNLSCKSA